MSTPSTTEIEKATGSLYSQLWGPYEQKQFDESVALFEKRLHLAKVSPELVKGKRCLDAGCGGGRNSIAMARLGAAEVVGVDVGEDGLADARRRAGELTNVRFQYGSLLELPFPDQHFDLVWCAGVVMHTVNPELAFDELARVLKPGGTLYLLVYASGGLRWPLIQLLRPGAHAIGAAALDQAVSDAGLPANSRRTFLDDLLVPCIDFFRWERLETALLRRGFEAITRWGIEPRLDHEATLAAYRADLEKLEKLYAAGASQSAQPHRALFTAGLQAIESTLTTVREIEGRVASGALSELDGLTLAVGQGHHRLICRKHGG